MRKPSIKKMWKFSTLFLSPKKRVVNNFAVKTGLKRVKKRYRYLSLMIKVFYDIEFLHPWNTTFSEDHKINSQRIKLNLPLFFMVWIPSNFILNNCATHFLDRAEQEHIKVIFSLLISTVSSIFCTLSRIFLIENKQI